MDRKTLSALGLELAKELNLLSQQYHVKSDARDILGYEAVTIEEEAKDLIENCGVREDLRESTLLSKWGEALASELPEITVRVKEFHENYLKYKNT